MAELSSPGQEGVSRSISDTPPTHYCLKLQSLSQLANNKIESYTSNEFQAGGCKWYVTTLSHPRFQQPVSMFDPHHLQEGRSSPKREQKQRHHRSSLPILGPCRTPFPRPSLGDPGSFPSLSLDTFKDAANGYLVNDTCVFGAEVYVCQETVAGKGECLSMIKDAIAYKHTWRLDFSSLTEECVDSKPFNAAEHKWKLQLYPKGKGSGVGGYVSLYLTLAAPENLPSTSKIYAEFTIRILDQLNRNHYFGTSNYWFSASNSTCGWPRFVSHAYFYQLAPGLLVKNMCLVEAEVKVHGVASAI